MTQGASYDPFVENQLNGTGVIDFDTDTLKVMLVESGYTFDASHEFRSSITNEASGTNYTAGGLTLGSVTVVNENGTTKVTAAQSLWTGTAASPFTFRAAVIYKDTGNPATDRLISYHGFASDTSNLDENVIIVWSDNGFVAWNSVQVPESLPDLSDVGVAAVTSGNVLVADGTTYNGRKLIASDVNAEASTDGYVLTSDGAGNADWEAPTGALTFPILADDGSEAAPSYAFSNTPGTGIYMDSFDSVVFVEDGTMAGSIGDQGLYLYRSDGVIRLNNGASESGSDWKYTASLPNNLTANTFWKWPSNGASDNTVLLGDGTGTFSDQTSFGQLTKDYIDSEASSDGFVLTSDGAGNAAWEAIPAQTDADAIHDNVAGEISAITAKASPVNGDFILIEDSADSNNKKRITIGDLPGAAAGVSSFNTRTGAVTAAASDYDASQIDNDSTVSGAFVDDALDQLDSDITTGLAGKANTVHTHAASDVVSGTFADARIAESNVTQHEAALTITESQISDLDHTDPDAIHDNVAGEISAIAAKGTPTSSDFLLIEDAADSNNKKRITIGDLPGGGGAVDSVFGRTGVVVAAASDYDASQIDNDSGVAGAFVDDALDNLDSGKADTVHTHAASDVTSGTFADARISESSVTQHEAALTITESQISDLDHDDPDAIHDNVAGEIAAVALKATPVSGDFLLIEDSADSNNKKRVTLGTLPSSGGLNAVVDDTSPDLGGQLVTGTFKIAETSAGGNNNFLQLDNGGDVKLVAFSGDIDIGDSDTDNITIQADDIGINAVGSGNLDITHGGTGSLDIDAPTITIDTSSNGDIDITPHGTGKTNITNIEAPLQINTQTGTTYAPVLADAEKMITLNNASAITATIPANSSVAYPVGTKLNFMQLGAGQVTIAITTDTLNVDSALTLKLNGQYAVATAFKVTSTSWVLFGNLEAA